MTENFNDLTLFMLINHLSRQFHNSMRTECDKLGFSQSFHSILFHLSNNPELSQHEIARMSHLAPPTISITLQKMEADGLIVRKIDEYDERRMRIYITEKGRMIDEQIKSAAGRIEKEMTDALSPDEIQTVRNCLIKLSEHKAAPHNFQKKG